MQISDQVKAMLVEKYKTCAIHVELDWEVNLSGNGTNCCEAMNVYNDLFRVLGLEKPEYTQAERDAVIVSVGEDPNDY